jgi:O-antigen/teichoic acid export membrane protein
VDKGLISDGAYVILGQIASAAGALVGVRLLTEVLEPRVFGSVTLLTGVVAFGQGITALGTLQAILRMFPECSRNGTVDLLRVASAKTLTKSTLWVALALAIGCLTYSFAFRGNPWSFVLVPGLLVIETVRLYHITLLNAARQQRLMASWIGIESWVRPIVALTIVYLVGANTQAVLGGFLVGTGVVWVCFSKAIGASHSGTRLAEIPAGSFAKRYEDLQGIEAEIIRYAKPLVPLGALGWLSGQADRFIIGGLLGLASAGKYAAIYGLVSRPFLMAGASVELIFRQFLYESVSSGDLRRARHVLGEWLGIVGALSVLGVIGFSAFYPKIAAILLAEPYREGASMVPWIATGYCLLLFAQVIERICYATKETGSVLLIQSAGALSSIPFSTIGVLWWGLCGAAIVVPGYFGLQLVVAIVFAYRSVRRHFHLITMATQ